MKNNKFSVNDGLAKEFYETFWDELKTPLMESGNQVFHTKMLSILQRKKDRDRRYIKTGGQFLC